LVVIAIIAILAAILFPVFERARTKALQASSLSNIRQLNMGIIMYTEDWNGCYPHTHADIFVVGDIDYSDFYTCIEPYVKNNDIWVDPGQPGDYVNDPGYAINAWMTFDTHGIPFNTTEITDPSNWVTVGLNNYLHVDPDSGLPHPCFHMWEWQGWTGGAYNPCTAPNIGTDTTVPSVMNQLRIHAYNNGANWAFADGHAKWGLFETLWNNNALQNAFFPWHDPTSGDLFPCS
jgi:prepilin-type processing-associated H-X9-DG protein